MAEPQAGAARDDRRSAAVAAGGLIAATRVSGFEASRKILRDAAARQAGFRAELVTRFSSLSRPPILYLSGEAHRRQRAGTARFFTPRMVATRYRQVMEAAAGRLLDNFVRDGGGALDEVALRMAVAVAADIVGLTASDQAGMARRLQKFFAIRGGAEDGRVKTLGNALRGQWHLLRFHLADVRPAIAARRRAPREDVISHLLAERYKPGEILTECLTYAAAGMATTREFISMAAWHMLERPELRMKFLAADEAGQIALLEEILRLEPVVGSLFRRVEGTVYELDLRAANAEAEAAGAHPLALDPERQVSAQFGRAGLAFGDGEHRCPGASVALHETAVFLDRLLRLDVRIARPPKLGWNPLIAGYELRDFVLVVAR